VMRTDEPVQISALTDEELQQYGIAILERELGSAGLERFIEFTEMLTGDYTRDRHKWQKGLTVQQIVTEIEKNRAMTKAG